MVKKNVQKVVFLLAAREVSQSEKFSFHIIRTISLRRYLFEREGGKESEREGERVSE